MDGAKLKLYTNKNKKYEAFLGSWWRFMKELEQILELNH